MIYEVSGVYGKTVDGVTIRSLKRVPDERGTILKIMSTEDTSFERFGEVYASTVYKDAVKAWHRHEEMTLNYVCLSGRVKCVVYDDRDDSRTKHNVQEIFLGPDSYNLLTIPPGVWNGFKGLTDAIVINCCTHAHDPRRSTRLPPNHPSFAYDWARKDC